MTCFIRFMATALLLLSIHAQADTGGFDRQDEGRRLTQAFYNGNLEMIWDRFDDNMRNAMGSPDQLDGFRKQIEAQLGAENEILDEKVMDVQGNKVYVRTVTYEKSGNMRFNVQWTFSGEGQVIGFFIRQAQEQSAAPTPHLDYETKAELHLPFRDEWYVFWGGMKPEQNYHVKSRDQRFAYDIVIQHDGSTHRGNGKSNEDYHCWNEPILAPADGEVIKADDRWPDNHPGQMDAEHPPGNYVVIDHGGNEYSFLAHLRHGSVSVSEGSMVKEGQQLGTCGNSGNSSEPHLHYHLQDTPDFGAGQGLPAWFNDYQADGNHIERGIPVKGQLISRDASASRQ